MLEKTVSGGKIHVELDRIQKYPFGNRCTLGFETKISGAKEILSNNRLETLHQKPTPMEHRIPATFRHHTTTEASTQYLRQGFDERAAEENLESMPVFDASRFDSSRNRCG